MTDVKISAHPADRRQTRRLRGELIQVTEDGIGDPLGHQVLHEIGFQRRAECAEQGKRGKQRQCNREHRHQRQDGGKREAAGDLRQTVVIEPAGGELEQVLQLRAGQSFHIAKKVGSI